MNSAASSKDESKDNVETIFRRKVRIVAANRPNVLISTIDPAIRNDLAEIFHSFPLNPVWSQGIKASKNILSAQSIAVCFSGFWLQDGTYRELVRHIRRERMNIPVVIVSGPSCPQEYGDYLSALNIGALDFLCYPYRQIDLERILQLSVDPQHKSNTQQNQPTGPEIPSGAAAA